ncbi:bifunctional glycoside hydrolase 114/ polysaccharide deacetylase family protein [Salinisphaera aquimarina]|uniref:Bifunctional glycoside hydrolase 114/ polysaccharide deacetylase family protein n=1 Tax=Salinisphaera aquimarina TaxID=2094031 RepID=A0ABV7ESD2_9GAMM
MPAHAAGDPQPSVSFYYGNDVPVHMLAQFDWAVVEAEHMTPGQRDTLEQYGTTAFAYVSLGEAEHWRGDDAQVPAAALKACNDNWNSQAADLTSAEWGDYLINQRIRPLWKQGYRALFLDTLDSYRLFAKDDASAAVQQQALVRLIKRIRSEFPGIKLLLNRGFEVLDQVQDDIVGVAAESLYKSWDPASQIYRDVTAQDSDYLLKQLLRVRNTFHLPAIAIDYVAPADRDQARATARKIANAGFVPWVTDGALDQVGVGSIEPMPRKVLVLYDKSAADHGELAFSNAHLYAAVPLEYLGYGAVYRDVNSSLPTDTLAGRYAGIVTWFQSRLTQTNEYRQWLARQMNDGVRVAIFGEPGFSVSGTLAQRMGVQVVPSIKDDGLAVIGHDDVIGFEGMPGRPPINESGYKVVGDNAVAHLTMKDGAGTQFVPVFTGDWGGVALSPWVLQQAVAEQARWVVDPFRFLQQALDLPQMPVPDATTENGSRYWMNEIDGDAFVNRADFPGSPYTGEVMLKEILRRYRVPTTVSVIEGELAPDGLYPKLTRTLEPIAREIFRLPWVEIGTHTYSHPFDWLSLKEGELAGQGKTAAGFNFNLPIKNYRYSLEKEVAGSTEYINENLAPPGKKVKIILWSGDSLPPEKALAIADRIGLANLNGGDTHVTRDNPSLTEVSPMLRPIGAQVQVFSPQINENVYTNDMTGPYWGFRRVIETYKITDSPRRLKPIDIYYHFYSAGRPASLNALKEVYDYVGTQQTLPLYTSTYSGIARNWYDAGVARTLDGDWQITGATQMRTLRLPAAMGWPDMNASRDVVGVRDQSQGRYVALSGAPRATLVLQQRQPTTPYLRRANGRVTEWQQSGRSVQLRLQSEAVPLQMELGGTSGCSVRAPGAARSGGGDAVTLRYQGTDSGSVSIDCG